MRLEHVVAVPHAGRDDDRELAQAQREAAAHTQRLSERVHELGYLRAVERKPVRPRDAPTAPSEQALEHSLLLGIEIAFGGDEWNARHGVTSVDMMLPGKAEYRMGSRRRRHR